MQLISSVFSGLHTQLVRSGVCVVAFSNPQISAVSDARSVDFRLYGFCHLRFCI